MNAAFKYLIFFCFIFFGAPRAYCEKDAGATRSEDPVANYNKGVVCYRKNDFGGAKDTFTKALITENKALETKAEYNTGNSLFKIAKAAEAMDPDRAMEALTQAAQYYQKAIELDPKDLDAKYNLELSQKLLKIIQKRPKLQQQSKNQNEEQNKEQNKEQKKEQNSQEQQKNNQQKQQNEQQKEQQEQQQNKKNKKEEKISEEEARMLARQFGQENLRTELNQEKTNQDKAVSKDW